MLIHTSADRINFLNMKTRAKKLLHRIIVVINIQQIIMKLIIYQLKNKTHNYQSTKSKEYFRANYSKANKFYAPQAGSTIST